jgi:hypothetical protein
MHVQYTLFQTGSPSWLPRQSQVKRQFIHLFICLCLLGCIVTAQDIQTTQSCPSNLTCPESYECYLTEHGLRCLPAGTEGCRALPLPNGDYYIGNTVGIHATCQHCPLPSLPSEKQLLISRYQQLVPGRVISVTLAGLGNCGPEAYCDITNVCQWRKKVLSRCESSEQCLGACIQNEAAGYPTCYDPSQPKAEAIQRLIYFGIYFGCGVAALLISVLACVLANQAKQRKGFQICVVIAVLLALIFMGIAVYWQAAPWPFSE